jgi:hypothetical protein
MFCAVGKYFDMTQCSPLEINRRFGETCLRFHGRRLSRAINRLETGGKRRRWFLALLFFDPEDGNDIFLRNVYST